MRENVAELIHRSRFFVITQHWISYREWERKVMYVIYLSRNFDDENSCGNTIKKRRKGRAYIRNTWSIAAKPWHHVYWIMSNMFPPVYEEFCSANVRMCRWMHPAVAANARLYWHVLRDDNKPITLH